MAKLGAALSGALPVVECDSSEVPCVVAAASGQLIVCVSNCVLLFLQRGGRWLVAVHCDDREVAVVGWKQPATECSQRPIQSPITEKPTVEVLLQWETEFRKSVLRIATNEDIIAVGMGCGKAVLLNAHTGAIDTDTLNGTYVAFLGKERMVGVKTTYKRRKMQWTLFDFTAKTLSRKALIEAMSITSLKASVNGKRLYVRDNRFELLELNTDNWLETARIPFSGMTLGQFGVAANGLLAQGIYHREDRIYLIEVIETNTHCVTQTIRTKHTAEFTQVVFSPNSSRIVSVAWDRTVQLFDAITGQMIGEPRIGHSDVVVSVCFLTDDWFVTVDMDNSVVIWHCDSQPPIARIELANDTYSIFALRRLSEDSFVTISDNGNVKRWLLQRGGSELLG